MLSDVAEALPVSNKICARAPDFHQDKGGSSHGQWGETGCSCPESPEAAV